MRKSIIIFTLFAASLLVACEDNVSGSAGDPLGLAETKPGDGPQVIFNLDAGPLPDIPFPNDVLTVSDEKTLTGRRINVSIDPPTQLERYMLEQVNTLDGFGAFAPISIRFDKPLDLSSITDDNILLIKLLPPDEGHIVPLDIGKGFSPTIWRPDHFWDNDPLSDANNILMDPLNMADLDGDTEPEFIDFYEFETDSLILRPIIPMEEAGRYAVVLLEDLAGTGGEPVRSPFEYINHTDQTSDLMPLVDLLEEREISLDQVAFCWSFTTQSVTDEWVRIWNGIYNGTGPLAQIAQDFPPVLDPLNLQISSDYDGNDYTLNSDWFEEAVLALLEQLGGAGLIEDADFRYIDYYVFGSFKSPSFFDSVDFGHPLIAEPRIFDREKLSGEKPAEELRVTWMLTVPRDEDLGLDGCQSVSHPQGCQDFEEPGAKGDDGDFGVADFDDNGDGYIDDEGEYMWPGSDDVADPAGDNYSPANLTGTQGNGQLDYGFGGDGQPGFAGVDDDSNGITDDITEFGWDGSDDGLTEDANGNGRLDTPPFPVAFHGHGHGNSYIESIGFMDAIARHGIAVLAIDSFGHGPFSAFSKMDQDIKNALEGEGVDLYTPCNGSSPSADCSMVLGFLGLIGIDLNGDHLINGDDIDGKTPSQIVDEMVNTGLIRVIAKEGRGYDIDGDTYKDSGAVFFTGNIFQTRDAVRQTAIDWMQLVRIVDSFGTQSTHDLDGDTEPDLDGDFNLDGIPDIGGPPGVDSRGHFYLGSSLGGIMGDVNMGVNPRILVGAPVSGAGGLADVIVRGHHRAATEPALLQSLGPVIVGNYDGTPGQVTLTFNDDPASEFIGYLNLPANGRVQVTNLTNGEVRTVTADDIGNFAANFPADVGDILEILSLDDETSSPPSSVLTYSKYHGLGLGRNTSDLRRYFSLAHMMLDRGDPIHIAKHYFTNDLGAPLGDSPDKSVLIINTLGDNSVPVAGGNAVAGAAGMWTIEQVQPLIDNTLNLGYIPESGIDAPIYDPEDLDDDGQDSDLAPLPVVRANGGPQVSAIRWHYVNEEGHHAFALPGSINHGIDWGVYMLNQIGYFMAGDGTCVIDDPWELHSAPHIHPGPNRVLETTPGGDDRIHTIRVLTTLGFHGCDYSFPTIQIITTGGNFNIDTITLGGDDVLVTYDDLYRGP